MKVAAFYNSAAPLEVAAVAALKQKDFTTLTLFDMAGMNEASIDALVATLSTATWHRIYICGDSNVGHVAATMTDAQVAAAALFLLTSIVDPTSDDACREFDYWNGTTKIQRCVAIWRDLFTETEPILFASIGTRFYTLLTSETATSGAASTITHAGAGWTVDLYINRYVKIVDGTGKGQVRKISDNDATTLTVSLAWTTQPDNTSVFDVYYYNTAQDYPVTASGAVTTGGTTTCSDSTKTFVTNSLANKYIKITGGTGVGGVRRIASNTGTQITYVGTLTVDTTSTYEVISYKEGMTLYNAYLPLYIQTYLHDFTDSDVLAAWQNLINKYNNVGTSGSVSSSQDLVLLAEYAVKGKAIYDYLNL